MEALKICVVGPGAVGLFLAERLSKAAEITLACPENSELIGKDLKISLTGDLETTALIPAEKIVNSVELYSLSAETVFLIAVKAYDIEELLPALDKRSELVVVSNGLGVSELLKTHGYNNHSRLLLNLGLQQTNSQIRISGSPKAILGLTDNSSSSEEIAALAEIEILETTELKRAEWSKALINIVVNTLCSPLELPNGAILDDPEINYLAEQLTKELVEIAAADGVQFPESIWEDLQANIANHRENLNSTLVDIQNGRKTETEFLAGAALRLARKYQTRTPVLESAYTKLCELCG